MSPCAAWASLSDKAAIGQSLTSEERLFLRSHPAGCSTCGAEALLWETLGKALEEPERLTDWPQEAAAQRRPSVIGRRAFTALTALVAVAAGLWLWTNHGGAPGATSSVASHAALAAVAPRPPVGARLAMAAGRVWLDSRHAVAGQSLPLGAVVSVEDGQACVLVPPGVTVCLESGTKLSVEALEPERRRLRLLQGHVAAHLSPQPAGSSFGFDTVAGAVVAKGTVFSLRSSGAAVNLRVHEGVVSNDHGGGQKVLYRAPSAALLSESAALVEPTDTGTADVRLIELAKYFTDGAQASLSVSAATGSEVVLGELSLGSPPVSALLLPGQYRMEVSRPGFVPIVELLKMEPGGTTSRAYESTPELAEAVSRPDVRRPRASATQLLEQARALRAEGRYRESHRAYQRLVREHASSAEARVALVSLGELQLSQLGDASAALRSFDAYLRDGGGLRQEAAYGRIRALRRLGKSAAANAAAEAFISAYPHSVQASSLRKELLTR